MAGYPDLRRERCGRWGQFFRAWPQDDESTPGL